MLTLFFRRNSFTQPTIVLMAGQRDDLMDFFNVRKEFRKIHIQVSKLTYRPLPSFGPDT